MTLFWPHDAGTEFRSQPHPSLPGLDLGRYIHGGGTKNWEFYFYELGDPSVQRRMNEAMLNVQQHPFRSWQPGMPSQSWVDLTTRYKTIEGWYVKLWQRDDITESYYECTAAKHTWIDPTYEPPVVDSTEVTSRKLTPSEAALGQAQAEHPGIDTSDLVRAPLQNETDYHGHWKGYTHLEDPIVVDLNRAYGPNILLEVPDSCLLFAPQNWCNPEWYQCTDINGVELTPTAEWLSLRPGAKYHIHLRPRLWRWEIFVLAHYMYITLWGMILNDEYFTHIYYDRPPFYLYRHDVINTKGETPVFNWNNQPRSYDFGIDYAWEHSDAAHDLSRQILEQQYTAPSMVYVFIGNEDPDVYLEAWAALEGDYVAIINRVDEASGVHSPVFVRQMRNLDSLYTSRATFGSFLARWQVGASGL